MSLDKAIEHGKERRKPFRKSKRFDKSCRNHGTCSYCRNNRLHSQHRHDPLLEKNSATSVDDTQITNHDC